jgi:LAS superfamily LD-carboxypeptidase LdcB
MNGFARIGFIIILAGVFIFFGFQSISYIHRVALESNLAATLAIELNAIREWQQRSGIRRNLAIGESSNDVKLLQIALKSNPEIGVAQDVTGYYGDATSENVKKFQEQHDLPVTGIVDTSTRDKINELYLREFCGDDTENKFEDLRFQKVDKTVALPNGYVPKKLVDISSKVKTIGISCLDPDAAKNLQIMFTDAEIEGYKLAVTSSFRRFEIQGMLYTFWHSLEGDRSVGEVAPPGHSEHQLGTAVDLSGESIQYQGLSYSFASSREGLWLMQNAYKYGFVMSYPPGKDSITGYTYEPWHYRYVGTEIATLMRTKQITLEEYFNQQLATSH